MKWLAATSLLHLIFYLFCLHFVKYFLITVNTILVIESIDFLLGSSEPWDTLIQATNRALTFVCPHIHSTTWSATPHSDQDHHHIDHIVMDTRRQRREFDQRWGCPTSTEHNMCTYNKQYKEVDGQQHTPLYNNNYHHHHHTQTVAWPPFLLLVSHCLLVQHNTGVLRARLKSSRED